MIRGYKKIVILLLILLIPAMSKKPGKPIEKALPKAKNFIRLKSANKQKHKVFIPPDYKMKPVKIARFEHEQIHIDIYARAFAQGNAAYVEIFKKNNDDKNNKDLTLRVKRFGFDKWNVPLTARSWGFRGLFGIHPELKPGIKKITIEYSMGNKKKTAVFLVKISKTWYRVYKKAMNVGKYSNVNYHKKPEVIAFIKKCTKKKRAVFSQYSPDLLGESFSHPRNMHYITSPFWSKRVVMQFKMKGKRKIKLKSRSKIHRGLDFRGNQGTPVYALAPGRVGLAEELFYEGNMVIIDHGNKVFSYYMHLHGVAVNKDRIVTGGNLIGYVGSTGVSTAAHLHVSLIIRGIQVDPLSLLPLPIR
ncbi:MAG: M23 family metallopeptidase [bacterium]|nr:M23 family metallopeptidase [bacterium]